MQVQNKVSTPQIKPGKDGNNSVDLLTAMFAAREKTRDKMSSIIEPNALIRCEVLISMFDELIKSAKAQTAPLEQIKGIRKGLDLSLPMILQHIEIAKTKYDTEPEKARFAIEIIQNCAKSVIEASKQQTSTVARTAGKFDGIINSATSILRKVEDIIANVKRTSQVAKELEQEALKDAEVDAAFESRAAARRKELEASTVAGSGEVTTEAVHQETETIATDTQPADSSNDPKPMTKAKTRCAKTEKRQSRKV